MREKFVHIDFQKKSLEIIDKANLIIADMQAEGYTLTLRQLYYQFVSRNWIANKQSSYDRLGKIIDKARKAGLIDWNAIEDRTRYLRRIPTYHDVPHFLTRMKRMFALDVWDDQDAYCEVWIEKDALVGVIEGPCNRWRVPYFACRGYPSSSELYVAGSRLRTKLDKGKNVFIFYLGDHDPSGLHMTVSADESLMMYARTGALNIVRLGLNMDQVEQYDPPENPAKETDARYAGYVREFGESCWELDALEPRVISQLTEDAIKDIIDMATFKRRLATEAARETEIAQIIEHYSFVMQAVDNVDDVKKFLRENL